MKTFKINENYLIVCNWVKTRYGFRHDASLMRDGYFVMKAKCCYYNRTWESFEYESVISILLDKAKILNEEQKKIVMDRFRRGYTDEVNQQFGLISAFAKMGEILCDTQKDKNDWKTRMIKAGLGDKGLIMPDDWDSLSEDEKETRLNGVINELNR